MAIRRIARPTCAILVNAQCRHSSSGRDCEFFVALPIEEEIQKVNTVNKYPATAGCCSAATKRLSNTLFSVVISICKRKEVAMGLTHSLNVLMISAAFLFIATMIFI